MRPIKDQPWAPVDVNQIDEIIYFIYHSQNVQWGVPARTCSDYSTYYKDALLVICNNVSYQPLPDAEQNEINGG